MEVEVFSIPSWGAPLDNPAGPDFHVVRYPDCTGINASRIADNLINNAMTVLEGDGFIESDVDAFRKALTQKIPGREYIITTAQLELHFEVLPQTFRIQAWGQVFQRPMREQCELEEAEALAAQLDPDTEPEATDATCSDV